MKTYKLLQPLILTSLLWIGSPNLWGQQAKNVVLASFMSTETLYGQPSFPYNTETFSLGDIWGWTYSGREFALICLASKTVSGSGLAMVEVTDPNNIKHIKTIKRGNGTAADNGPQDVRVFCTPSGVWYAFVSQDNSANYYVDLVTALTYPSDPSAGVTEFPAGSKIHNLHINVNKGLLFLSDFIQGLSIPVYDINNVSATSQPVPKGNIPQLISNASSHDLHASDTRVYDASLRGGTTITVYTYANGTFNYTSQRRHFYNVKRGKHPSKYIPPDTLQPFTHDAVPSTNELYLYTTTERVGGDIAEDSPTRQRGAYLYIWDISNIDAPLNQYGSRYPIKKVYEVKEATQTPSFNDSTFAPLVSNEFSNSIHNVQIRNESGSDVAYISYYTKGLRILNVANPLNPSEIGYYDTPGVGNYIYPVYDGPWGVYPFFNSGTIIVSDVRGLYIFRRASECSGTIATNTTWSNAIFVTGNVTVNSGATLTISPGTTLAFANGTSLTVNGNLIAVSDDPNKRISFTSNTAPLAAGAWNGITINANANTTTLRRCDVQYAMNGIYLSYTGNSNNVTVEKCKIRFNSADGVTISGNNYSGATVHPLIKDNTISNNVYGFELYDYAKPTITGNRIENNTNAGIFGDSNCNAKVEYNYIANNSTHGVWFIISCNAAVHRNTIKSNGTRGITCAVNSNVLACGTNSDTTKGRNEIASNSGVGIYAATSSPNFGKDLATLYGNNWMHDNTSYEAQQASSGYQIHARRCYWSGQQSNVSGTVYTTPVLSSAPSPVGWGRSTSYDPTYLKGLKPGMIAELPPVDSHHNTATRLTVNAGTNGAPAEWTEELKAAIEQGLNTGDWSKAGEVVAALHRELQDARVPDVDFALVDAYANDARVAAFIRKMLALVLMENDLVAGKTSDALTKLAAFIQSNSENAAELLANAGVIHLYRLNDLATTQTILSQLQTMAKNGDAVAAELVEAFGVILLRYQRQQAIISQRGGLEKPMIASLKTPTLPKVSALAQNYPNPFNPETTIRFRLSEGQKIRLVIFDITGQRVRTLLEGEIAAGEQTISWDGRDQQGRLAASGIYFYELVVGNKIERRKMTLIR